MPRRAGASGRATTVQKLQSLILAPVLPAKTIPLVRADLAKRRFERARLRRELAEITRGSSIRVASALAAASPEVKKEVARAKARLAATRRRLRPRVHPPAVEPGVPALATGSLIHVVAPPYGFVVAEQLDGAPSDVTQAPSADADAGTFGAVANSSNGSADVLAGVGFFFHPATTESGATVRPYARCSYSWSDMSNFLTAHNDGTFGTSVYTFHADGTLAKFPPDEGSLQLWSDGTGWLDSHSDAGDNVWPGFLEVPFALTPGEFFVIVVWCECALDGAESGAFLGWAQATLQTSLPLCYVQEGGF